jgi:hypothetical protein
MNPDLDEIAALAKQHVATVILLPVRPLRVDRCLRRELTVLFSQYVLGLCIQVLLIGVFLALFTLHYRADISKHSTQVKVVSWIVFVLVLGCLGMSFEEIIDTASTSNSASAVL